MRHRILVAAAVALAACGGSEPTTGPTPPAGPVVAAVEVTPAADTVRVGAAVQFLAVAKDAQGTAVTGRTVSWTTSNSAMATVSPAGEVTGVARGTATVTATVDGRSGSATVVVEDETSLLPAAGCRDCLEIVPGGLLLTGPGQEAPLVAYQVDAAGARTKVSATFTSAKPAVVTVSGSGVARAVAYGSAQVTAAANGKTSAPIVVLVATPAQGAMLVADTVVDGWPTPVNPQARFGVGYKYRVRLRGMSPSVGQMLVSSGSLPILGRVAAVRPAAAGVIEAEVEVRPLAEAFTRLDYRERITLTDLGPAAVPPAGGLWRAAGLPQLADDPLEEGQFRLGPFVCEAGANVGLSIPVNLVVERAEIVPQLVADVAFEDGSSTIAVSGSLSPRLVINATLTGSLEAEFECRDRLFRIPIHRRLLGALGAIIEPRIPVGVGFKLAIKAELPGLGLKSSLAGSVSLGIANVCSAAGCGWTRPVLTNNLVPQFEPAVPSLGDVRHEMSVGVFPFLELELTNPITEELGAVLSEDFSLTFFDFQAGFQQKIEVASPLAQTNYADYASQASLSAFFEASSEAELELGELLSITLLEYQAEGDTALAETPKGDLFISDATVRAGVGDSAGPKVLLRATIFPVTYLGAPSVEGVEFFRKRQSGALESVCGFITPDHAGQVEFECERGFTEAEVGTHEIYAFVTARLFGRTFSTPLEIAPDSKVAIEVLPPCATPSAPFPTPRRAGDACVEPLTISNPFSATIPVNVGFTGAVIASGGTPPYSFSIVGGGLPPGLLLNGATGEITGTPGTQGSFPFTVRVSAGSESATGNFGLTVTGPGTADPWSGLYDGTGSAGGRSFDLRLQILQYHPPSNTYTTTISLREAGTTTLIYISNSCFIFGPPANTTTTGTCPAGRTLSLARSTQLLNQDVRRAITGTIARIALDPTNPAVTTTVSFNLLEYRSP